jgi:hypothetical protein
MMDRRAWTVRDPGLLISALACVAGACCARQYVCSGSRGHGMPCPYSRTEHRDGVGPVPYRRPESSLERQRCSHAQQARQDADGLRCELGENAEGDETQRHEWSGLALGQAMHRKPD